MLLFIGQMIPKDYMEWYIQHSRTPVPTSSETHQRAIVKALETYDEVYSVCSIPAGFFPLRFNVPFINGKEYKNNRVTIFSSTIPIVRNLVYINNLYKECEKAIDRYTIDCIYVYMPYTACSVVIKMIKKHHQNIPIVMIVPDLIKHCFRKEGNKVFVFLKRIIRKNQGIIVRYNTRRVDGFIYLSEKMKEEFGADRPFMVMESIYEPISVSTEEVSASTGAKKITYCGKVSEENGVRRLVNAFIKVSQGDKWQLMICGTGDLLNELQKIAVGNQNVIFTGQVTHDEVIRVECESTVLVNPRYTNIDHTAYSFPSKLIEYMACGKAVLSSKLPAITLEYDDYLMYIENDSQAAMEIALRKIMAMDDEVLNEKGIKNAQFVLNHKSTTIQGLRIRDFTQQIKERL